MIVSLSGILAEKTLDTAILDVGGVGYLLFVPTLVAGQLPAPGRECSLFTYMNVTENDVNLYGFATREQQQSFKMLTGVSGVGPKAGLAILSVLTPGEVALAVAAGDFKAFTAASGVGPKLGQRIVLELKDKVAKEFSGSNAFTDIAAVSSSGGTGAPSQAVAALVALGYTQSEAAGAIAGLPPEWPVEELVRQALRKIAGGK